jgi:hypothetical protein
MKKYNALVLYDPDTGKFPSMVYSGWDRIIGENPHPALIDDISQAEFRPEGSNEYAPYDLKQIAPNCRWVKVRILLPETFGEQIALHQNEL